MAMVKQEIAHRGWSRYRKQAIKYGNQLSKDYMSWSRKQWFPRWQDVVYRPAGPLLQTDIANRGFSSY